MSALFPADWRSNFDKDFSVPRSELLAACLRLQCKTLNRPEVDAIVIKTASMMISLVGDIAR